ncbi:MAG: hypothetical protein JRJ87_16470 [Deltaproteobacteria bacterium]|nr:hypothetical protein [Deltaproteobacteria bacterium]
MKMRFSGFLAIALVFFSGLTRAQEASPATGDKTDERTNAKYLFWHLTPTEGASPEITSRIERNLRLFFEKQQGRLLMDGLTMDSLLLVEGNEKFLRCGSGPACVSGLGEIAGIKQVIAGEVKKIQGRLIVELVLVDTENKSVISRAAIESGGPPSKKHMQELSVAMFAPDAYKGSVELSCAVADAEVLIDKVKVGVTPLVGPLTTLAGKHLFEVKKFGHQTFSRVIRVPLDGTKQVVALLPEDQRVKPENVPFYKHWAFWTFTGSGVVATAIGIVLHLDANVLDENAQKTRENNLADYQTWQDKADSRHLQAYIVFGVGGVALLAAGVVAIIDVAGQSDEPNHESRVDISVLPYPSGAGLSATFRF